MEAPAHERHVPLTEGISPLCPVPLCPVCLEAGQGICSAHGLAYVDRVELERSFADPFLGRVVLVRGRPYALAGVAGRGSQSRVFSACPLEGNGSAVAVKLVRLDAPNEGLEPCSVVARRLRRELEVGAALEGVSGVPRPLGLVEASSPGLPPFDAIAFEWIERVPLPRTLAAGHVVGWARTVHAAHGLGLVHADLAPDHLAWGPGGSYVLDWGCSVAVGAVAEAGRRAYASPELAATHCADAASDWFAFGASLRALGARLTDELDALVQRLVGAPEGRSGAAAELVSFVPTRP